MKVRLGEVAAYNFLDNIENNADKFLINSLKSKAFKLLQKLKGLDSSFFGYRVNLGSQEIDFAFTQMHYPYGKICYIITVSSYVLSDIDDICNIIINDKHKLKRRLKHEH